MSARSPLRFPTFRSLWFANLVTGIGYMIQSVGASWLMLELTSSPSMVALVQTSITLPIMLFSVLAGATADSWDRRRLMLWSQTFMMAVSIGLAVLTHINLASPYMLLAFTFLIGCGNAFNAPAWQASVGDMVPKALLPDAVALNSAAFNTARSAGPALGGAIVAAAGATTAFMVNCATYPLLIITLLRWHPKPDPSALPAERIAGAIASGVRYVFMSPDLLKTIARAMLISVCVSSIPSLLPIIVRDGLNGAATTYGLLLAAFGAGAVTGALVSAPLRSRYSVNRIISAAIGLGVLGLTLTALSTSPALTVLALIIAGGGWILALSTLNVTMQLATPRWVLARALSLYQMAAFGGIAVGSSVFGAISSLIGVSSAMIAAAMLLSIGLAAGFLDPLPDLDGLDLDPLRKWQEPEAGPLIEANSGPISITIHYEIDTVEAAAFIALMRERRRIRRRDGARNWVLLRDVSQPNLWIERYQVATWLEYVRHNQRRTQADAVNIAAITALHTAPGPPKIYRRIQVDPHSRQPDSAEQREPLFQQVIPGAP
ncbi:MFS transporter [Rhizorhabdus dicambivorans]|uniref:MFS transporter n=2 Tax=Rhizorhabdus dicambivorans TaxID=1850238 RepID=A0A2A4FPU1_9SPHN|nr:MFS transporter [Rhizorhabdus dicambivorans]PCE39722.1 MFS transporter [Rhizorhabdus dicambivorans]